MATSQSHLGPTDPNAHQPVQPADPFEEPAASTSTPPVSPSPGEEIGGYIDPNPVGGGVVDLGSVDLAEPLPGTEPPETPFDEQPGGGASSTLDLDYKVPGAGRGPKPFTSPAGGVEAVEWEITPEQRVMDTFLNYSKRDNPLFDHYRQAAMRAHGASGGQNSALAAGMGEEAAMRMAFEMAGVDSERYARSGEFNAMMKNQFGLAEQQFIHQSLLSDQNFKQAKVLQTQRIAGELEAISLEFKGRSQLMDKELEQWFEKAEKQHELILDEIWERAEVGIWAERQMDPILEGRAQRDFGRQWALVTSQSMASFFTSGFSSIMQMAADPNLTPEQQRGVLDNGFGLLRQWSDVLMNSWSRGFPQQPDPTAGLPGVPQGEASFDWTQYDPQQSAEWMNWMQEQGYQVVAAPSAGAGVA